MLPTRHGPGAVIDRYVLLRTLGSGGSGTVFEAHDPSIGRRVALKILNRREGVESARRAEARFLRERRIVIQIRHPNVIDVLDIGVDQGVPFLVMELVEGETLAGLVARERRLPLARAVEISLPIVSAVSTLHAGGIIHRDIKPANVLLPAGRVLCPKLADFGACWCDDDSPPITRPGALVGTPEYIAPELIRFRTRATERSDQYALGVLLYECVTGVRPFEGSTKYQRLHAAVNAEVVPPSSHVPSLPAGFDEVVLRAMQRDPLLRFPSVDALGEALLPFVVEPVAAQWRRVFTAPELESALPPSRRVARSSALPAESAASVPPPSAPPASVPPASVPPPEARLRVYDGVAISARGNFFGMLWSEASRVERVRWQFDELEAAMARASEPMLVLMIILPTADPPDKPARDENDRRIRELQSKVRMLSTVIVGDGVRQVLVRSIVRAMLVPHRLGGDRSTIDGKIDSGIARLRNVAGPSTPAVATIHADVCAMYAALGLPAPKIGRSSKGGDERDLERQSA